MTNGALAKVFIEDVRIHSRESLCIHIGIGLGNGKRNCMITNKVLCEENQVHSLINAGIFITEICLNTGNVLDTCFACRFFRCFDTSKNTVVCNRYGNGTEFFCLLKYRKCGNGRVETRVYGMGVGGSIHCVVKSHFIFPPCVIEL